MGNLLLRGATRVWIVLEEAMENEGGSGQEEMVEEGQSKSKQSVENGLR